MATRRYTLYQINEGPNESQSELNNRLRRRQSVMITPSQSMCKKVPPMTSKASFLSIKSEPGQVHDRKLALRLSAKMLNESWNTSFTSGSSRISHKSDGSEKSLEDRRVRRRLSRRLSKMKKFVHNPTLLIGRTLFTSEELRAKFRYVIRMVRFLVRLYLALKDYSREKDKDSAQSIDQLNYYCMESEFTTKKLAFSKSHFSASNVVYMPAWARKAMTLCSWERSQSDVERIASLIRRFFSKTFLEENLLYLCKHCIYTRYEQKRVLIRSGHRPLYCYLLFSGSVFVNIEEQDKSSGKKYYRTEAVLKRGALFGEIGVMNDMPRTATIVTRENVECLLIPPDICKRVFPEENDREFKFRLGYMKECDLFADWPDKALQELCVVSKTAEYAFDEVFEKNTLESQFIYMVIKGRVEIMGYANLSDAANQQLPSSHAFLPPIPVPHPQRLLSGTTDSKTDERMVMSIDFLYPFQSFDLLSLVKSCRQTPFILVSRGAEVIRFPKLRLQTIPPLRCWKTLLEKAKSSPKYPGNKVLSRLCVEHQQWSAYKKLVLWDTVERVSGRFSAMKAETSKTAVRQFPGANCNDDDDDGFALDLEDFKSCLEHEAPLHDLMRHNHTGLCIRSWNSYSSFCSKPSFKTHRSLSTHC